MEILAESTVLESISCPSCSTHYGLRPERVRPGLRRALCLRCGEIFDIESAIAHLLALMPAPEVPEVLETSETPETADTVQAEDFLDLDLSVLTAPDPEPEPEVEPTPEPTPASPDPALSLSDLEDSEDEIFEKTLMIDPVSELAPAVAEGPDGAGGFSSAKDAISKLLGDSPAPAPADRRTNLSSRGNSMDVEATLDALEHTLGGSPVAPAFVPPTPAVHEPASGSTVRLSSSELQAAMAAGTPAAPVAPSLPPTVAIPVMPPAFAAPAPEPVSSSDSNLLKIQIGQETYQNVSLDQVTMWIEHGRVQDFHMVARQFSDNWIEAGKVPSLRPVFERTRRAANAAPVSREPIGPPPEGMPLKKGLFGGIFGRS